MKCGVKALLITNVFLQTRRLTRIVNRLFCSVRWSKVAQNVSKDDPGMGDKPRQRTPPSLTHKNTTASPTHPYSPDLSPLVKSFPTSKIAATKALSPGCPWNSATMAAVPTRPSKTLLPAMFPALEETPEPSHVLGNGVFGNWTTKTNLKGKRIFRYWLSPGTFGYAFTYK